MRKDVLRWCEKHQQFSTIECTCESQPVDEEYIFYGVITEIEPNTNIVKIKLSRSVKSLISGDTFRLELFKSKKEQL